jgi:uncharacterized protein YbjQ (UPF0145 family)
MEDGSIDYSTYSRLELTDALSSIDKHRYPKNYANLVDASRRATGAATHLPSSSMRADPMHDSMVTSAFDLPGYKITKNHGVVRGLTVRSRSIVGNFFGGLQSLFGGNITIYSDLCEQARAETYRFMCQHAQELGANAIIAMRYDATELMPGLTEVLCYGTAVTVEIESPRSQ